MAALSGATDLLSGDDFAGGADAVRFAEVVGAGTAGAAAAISAVCSGQSASKGLPNGFVGTALTLDLAALGGAAGGSVAGAAVAGGAWGGGDGRLIAIA